MALIARQAGRELVVAADPPAEALGIFPGLPLADARALCPGLRVVPHDPAGDAAALRALAAWATRYSPWAAPCATAEGRGEGPGGAGGLLLEVTGCAHLFAERPPSSSLAASSLAARSRENQSEAIPGETALVEDLLRRLAAAGFTARVGLADTIGTAWALSHFPPDHFPRAKGPGGEGPWASAAPGQLRAALAELPPAALRLPSSACDLLARFGIHRIEQLAQLPAVTLAARFGDPVNRRLRQALGEAGECLDALLPVPPIRVRRLQGEPIMTAEAIMADLEGLIAALCLRLEAEGQGARRLELLCYRVDASLLCISRGTSRPSRDPRHLIRLFAEAAQEIDPGFGIESLVLQVPRSEPLAAGQLPLELPRRPAAACDESLPDNASLPDRAADLDLAALADRLEARLGPGRLLRPRPQESHTPERAVAFAAPLDPALVGGLRGGLPEASPSLRRPTTQRSPSRGASSRGLASPQAALWRPALPRPLRLLPRPEPVEATALLPDHPPVRFRWRRLLHRVQAAEGPERLTPEWWLPDADGGPVGGPGDGPGEGPDGESDTGLDRDLWGDRAVRDYFRVAVAGGGRYWLYHAGGRWFLHGIFG